MDNIICIWIAFVLDLIVGDPQWFPHPVRLIGKLITFYENSIRKLKLKKKGMIVAGIGLVIVTIAISFAVVFAILYFAKQLNIYLYYILNIGFMWTCLALKCLGSEAKKIYNTLEAKDITLARVKVGYLVSRDTSKMNERDIAKATVETVVENTSDGIIAPLFYMLIGGAPLAMAYKAVNTMDSMVGYKNEKYENFGFAAAKFDDIVNFIPARITGILMVISTFFCKQNFKNSWKILKRDRRKHESPNSAYPEAAAAGAIGIQLGGPSVYFGKVVFKPKIGEALKKLTREHINEAIQLMFVSTLVMLDISTIIYIVVNLIMV